MYKSTMMLNKTCGIFNQNENDENVKEEEQADTRTLGKENTESCYENEVEVCKGLM